MKKNFWLSGGVAAVGIAVVGGLFAVGGCSGTVMGERQYVPVKDEAGLEQFPASEKSAPAVDANAKASVIEAAPANEEVKVADSGKAGKKVSGGSYEAFDFKKSNGVSSEAVGADGVYVVKSGDTLGRIARRHGLKLAELMKLNNMTANDAKRLRVGQKLAVSAKGSAVVGKSAKAVKSGKTVKSAKSAVAMVAVSVNDDGTYTVKRGDSIPLIARKLGVRSAELQEVNGLSDADTRRLQIGQKLKVPGKSAAVGVEVAKPVDTPVAVNPVATVETQPAADAVTPAAPADTAAPAAAPAAGEVVTGQTDLEVQTADTTVAAVAARHNISEDTLRKMNPAIPASGEIKKDEIIFVPVK